MKDLMCVDTIDIQDHPHLIPRKLPCPCPMQQTALYGYGTLNIPTDPGLSQIHV